MKEQVYYGTVQDLAEDDSGLTAIEGGAMFTRTAEPLRERLAEEEEPLTLPETVVSEQIQDSGPPLKDWQYQEYLKDPKKFREDAAKRRIEERITKGGEGYKPPKWYRDLQKEQEEPESDPQSDGDLSNGEVWYKCRNCENKVEDAGSLCASCKAASGEDGSDKQDVSKQPEADDTSTTAATEDAETTSADEETVEQVTITLTNPILKVGAVNVTDTDLTASPYFNSISVTIENPNDVNVVFSNGSVAISANSSVNVSVTGGADSSGVITLAGSFSAEDTPTVNYENSSSVSFAMKFKVATPEFTDVPTLSDTNTLDTITAKTDTEGATVNLSSYMGTENGVAEASECTQTLDWDDYLDTDELTTVTASATKTNYAASDNQNQSVAMNPS